MSAEPSRSFQIAQETTLQLQQASLQAALRIENAFNRLKDFRRVATHYDRLALNYLASVCLAAALVWWI